MKEEQKGSLQADLAAIVGERGLLTGEDVTARPNGSMGRGQCPAVALVRPANSEEVSAVLKLCQQRGVAVVTHGGRSGTVDGIACGPDDIVLSLERMSEIERLDAEAGVMVVQAGAILESVQQAADEAGWKFAVDHGARGSATVGGIISTNAGGNNVVRYGNTREQILGLEVVMADGSIVSSMNEMLKNNTGYDLKQLFIGAEGTLGIVTKAVLRLRPRPRAVQTAFVAVPDFPAVATLLRHLGTAFDGRLSSFEVMWQDHYKLMTSGEHTLFLPDEYPFYVLLEQETGDAEAGQEHFMVVLGELMEEGLVVDAVIAQSESQAEALWAMRDDVRWVAKSFRPMAAYDVSLPLRHMDDYVQNVRARLAQQCPGVEMVAFGHLGDGNIHFLAGPVSDHGQVDDVVYGELTPMGGSISAEHGIGLEKRAYLTCSRNEAEIGLMKTLKKALDPQGLLNPGKIFELP